MAFGRISGPLLKENLLRNETNLAIETNLLYLNVNTHADDVDANPNDPSTWTGLIGIRNSSPSYPLDVTGTFRATTILGGRLEIDDVLINDNSISSQLGNLVLSATGLGIVSINSNTRVEGDLHVTGNITADGSLQFGDQNTDNVVFAADVNSDIMPNITDTYNLGEVGKRWKNITTQTANLGAVAIVNNTIETSVSNGDLYINSNGTGSVIISNLLEVSAGGGLSFSGQDFSINNLYLNGDGDYSRIQTLDSNTDLHLLAHGTGNLKLDSDTDITGNLTVSGTTELTGSLTASSIAANSLVVDTTSTLQGQVTANNNVQINGALTVTGEIISGPLRTTDIQIVGNRIETTASNSNFEINTVGTGSIELQTNTNVTGTFDVSGQSTLASANIEDLTSGRVVLAGTSGELEDSANLTFNGTTLTVTGDETVTGTATLGNLLVNDLATFTGQIIASEDINVAGTLYVTRDVVSDALRTTDIRIVGNRIETTASNSNFEIDTVGTGTVEILTNTNITGNLDVSSQATLASANIEDLTSGRIVLAGNLGELEDSANLTFNGTTLTVTGNETVTGTATLGNLLVNGTSLLIGSVTATDDFNIDGTLTVGGSILTDDIRVVGNRIETTSSNSNVEINAAGTGTVELLANTNVTGTFDVSGQSTLASINVEDLTSGRVVLAGASGELEDSANLTFNGTILTVTGNQHITGNLDIDGNITLGGNIRIGDQDADTITIVADFTSNLLPDQSNAYDLGRVDKSWRTLYVGEFDNGVININNNTIRTTVSNADLELIANGNGIILVPSSDVTVEQALTVNGTTTLDVAVINGVFTANDPSIFNDTVDINSTLTITGTTNFNGDVNHTGNMSVSVDLSVTNSITTSIVQTGDIRIAGNVVTTTLSNSALELRANGTGTIELQDSTNITGTLDVSGQSTLASINVEDLTSGRVVLAGANGELEDSANLTFNGTALTVTGNQFITGNLDVTGDITLGGNIRIGDTALGTVTVEADFTSDLIPDESNTYDLGTPNKQWRTINVSEFNNGVISINTNVITTTVSNADLELRASGVGNIVIGAVTVNGTSINTADSSGITIIPTVTFNSDVIVENNLVVTNAITADNLTLSRDLAVNGGDLTTSASTFNLINDTATTVNFAGDATAINIGADTGTLTINNSQVIFNTTDSIQIPVGVTAERDQTPTPGQIRYNSELSTFEGYGPGNTWGSLGGIKDVDGNTYIIPELSPGSNENVLYFYTDGELTATLDKNQLEVRKLVVDDISINGNVIETTASNSVLELRTNGTGYVAFTDLNAVKLPVGTTNEQGPGVTGQVRFNTDTTQFEGYNGTAWSSLGGVRDVDGNTYIVPELSSGSNENVLYFYADGELAATLDNTTLNIFDQTFQNDQIRINDNIIETYNSNTDLVLGTSGTGIVYVSGTGAIRIPTGTTIERPVVGESGQIRYNSQTNNLEAWNGVLFTGISGGSSSDADGDTFISFETSGNNENVIRFYIGVDGVSPLESVQRVSISDAGLVVDDNIRIQQNYIETTASNSDLELRASGTGIILVPNNNVVISNNFTVNDTTTLNTLVVTGATTLDETTASNIAVTGNLTVTGTATISEIITNDVRISGNRISTTQSNSNLELTSSGTGIVSVQDTLFVTQDFSVVGTSTLARANVSDLIDGRITHAGVNGRLKDSANLAFDGTTLALTGNQTISGILTVGGVNVSSSATFNDVEISELLVNGRIRIYDNIIENTLTNDDLIIRANGTGRVIIDGAGTSEGSGNIYATDPLITLNSAYTTSNTYDSGLIIERGIDINVGVIWDESEDQFAFIRTIEQGTVRGNVAITGYQDLSVGTVKLNSETASKVTFTDANKYVRSLDSGTTAYVDGVIKFNTGAEAAIPTGTTLQRPATPQEGTVRFNTTDLSFEGYAEGSWRSMGFGSGTAPTYQGFLANGVDFEFTLSQIPFSAAAIMVAINGVVQEPDIAYSVDGAILRFIDDTSTVVAPEADDRIDVRFLSMPAVTSVHTVNFTADGISDTFDTLFQIPNEESIMVFVNNVYQDTEVYDINGTEVTFISEIPALDERINIVVFPTIIAPDLPTKTYVDQQINLVSNTATDDAIAFAIALG